jgi:hypothetical protein
MSNEIVTGRKRLMAAAAALVIACGFGVAHAQQGGAPAQPPASPSMPGMGMMHEEDEMPMGMHGSHEHEGDHEHEHGHGDEHEHGHDHEHGGMGMMEHGGMMGHAAMHEMMMMCEIPEHLDGKLAFIKAELKITDAQTPQWNSFVDGFRAQAQKTAQHCAVKKHGEMGGSVIDRLDHMQHHLTMHMDYLQAIKAALQPLYGVLSDEQKKVADEIIAPRIGVM